MRSWKTRPVYEIRVKPKPKVGDVRTITKYLWFPVQGYVMYYHADGRFDEMITQWRWLETTTYEQKLFKDGFNNDKLTWGIKIWEYVQDGKVLTNPTFTPIVKE